MLARCSSFRGWSRILNIENCRNYAGVHQKQPQIKIPAPTLETIKAQLSQDLPPSHEEWKQIRASILNERRFNRTNVDGTILGLCPTLDCGHSYMEFLRASGFEVNLATTGRLLRLYRFNKPDGKVTAEDEANIWATFRELMEKNPVLDASTCEYLISALTLTKHWRSAFELLEMIKLTVVPSSSAYNHIVEKLFLVGEVETGWKLLEEMSHNKRLPVDEVFLAWLEHCKKDLATFERNLQRMLQFTGDHSVFLSHRIGDELKALPQTLGIKGQTARINDIGKCSQCKNTITSIIVPDDAFHRLRESFLESVLIKKEIFNRTTPEELKRFQQFLKRTMPYDLVIDGLNVAFSTGNQKSPTVYAQQIASVVRHYVQQKKRVLVIGRQHMKKWQSRDMKYIRENSFLFLTEDLSQDDPFLLYAALESGPKTDFFSRDLMRRHSFLLGDDLGKVFKRWQQQHQYSLLSILPNGRVMIQSPFQHELFAHKSDDKRWHIPLVESSYRIQKVEKQESWLCLQMP